MCRHKGPHVKLTIDLHRGLYLAIFKDRHEGPNKALTIAWHIDLYLDNIVDRHELHILPLL
jgi:hypothetical protein